MANPRYVPDFRIRIGDEPVPAAMRVNISSVSYQTGLEGADRLEFALVNQALQWLDHPLLAPDNPVTLELGYAPDPLAQIFVGEIVGLNPSFPSSGGPTLTVIAHDRRNRMQQGSQQRWFVIPVSCRGNYALNDLSVIGQVALENTLLAIPDPVSAVFAVLIGRNETAVARGDPDKEQKIIRKQVGETDFNFLLRIAHENGWEMIMEHDGPLGGRVLRFMSPLAHLLPEVSLQYGRSLIEFNPRLSQVGQVAAVSVPIWQPSLQTAFVVTVGWDWNRNALDISIKPGYPVPGGQRSEGTQVMLLEEPVTEESAPRLIVNKLLERLNRRLTGSGSTIGDTRIRAGTVLHLEGLGEQFSGLWRVTSATHTLDSGGYRTSFEVRKEVWFGSMPRMQPGPPPLHTFQGVPLPRRP